MKIEVKITQYGKDKYENEKGRFFITYSDLNKYFLLPFRQEYILTFSTVKPKGKASDYLIIYRNRFDNWLNLCNAIGEIFLYTPPAMDIFLSNNFKRYRKVYLYVEYEYSH